MRHWRLKCMPPTLALCALCHIPLPFSHCRLVLCDPHSSAFANNSRSQSHSKHTILEMPWLLADQTEKHRYLWGHFVNLLEKDWLHGRFKNMTLNQQDRAALCKNNTRQSFCWLRGSYVDANTPLGCEWFKGQGQALRIQTGSAGDATRCRAHWCSGGLWQETGLNSLTLCVYWLA